MLSISTIWLKQSHEMVRLGVAPCFYTLLCISHHIQEYVRFFEAAPRELKPSPRSSGRIKV